MRSYWAETHNEPEAPTPARPRHTIEEFRKILAAADQIDPRLGLLVVVGAELRLGQVARAKRSHVDFVRSQVVISSKGKKRGAVVKLTTGQLAALSAAITTGYLRELEAAFILGTITNYPLFPSGQLPGARVIDGVRKSKGPTVPTATVERHATASPINRRTITELFELAEDHAGVQHVPGRGAYGLRRVAVDAAKQMGISREGLKEHGGWTDTQMPDMVYADQDAEKPREEARDVRAMIRGEPVNEPSENAPTTQQTLNGTKEVQGAVA